jgi:sigma-B regulation protein RsbU (phosphoserine phosphatase)
MYVAYEGLVDGLRIIGPRDVIERRYVIERFMREYVNALIAFVMLIIGLYHLLIYVKRPKDRENLYYAIVSIFFTVYQTNFYATATPFHIQNHLSYLTFQKIIFISLYLSSYSFVLFANSFFDVSLPRKAYYVIGIFFIIPTLLILFIRDYGFFVNFAKLLNAVIVLPTLGYCFSLIAYKAIRKNRLARITLYGLIPFAFAVIFDIVVHNIMKEIGYIYLAGLGFPTFLISIMFILANRFVEYHNEVEELNITLDQKVVERTRELKEANEKLAAAYESMNRDMKMAVSVQESFLPLRPTAYSDWDIALYFKPMSGVSGDFFDFYEREGNLAGIAVFDVSGHGVASGLLTMVAKSILHKNFYANAGLRLGAVIEKANDDLIAEFGDLGYYISGVMVRFEGDSAEYVNAAHADLLIRRSSGEIKMVATAQKAFRGNFLGLAAMKDRFNTVKFRIEKGDALLLCTDGIIESYDAGQNQYGIERLMDAFKGIPVDADANQMLDHILNDFHSFTGHSDNFRDDITLIIVRRRA